MSLSETRPISGIDCIAEATREAGSALDIRQLGRGSIKASTWLRQSDAYLLSFINATQPLEAEGDYPKGQATLIIPIGNMVITQNGEYATEEEWIYVPADSGSFIHSAKCRGGAILMFHFPASAFEARIGALAPETGLPSSSANKLIPRRIRATQFLHLAEDLKQTGSKALAGELFAALESLLIEAMLDAAAPAENEDTTWRSGQSRLQAARGYMESNLGLGFRLSEMCEELDIPHRTLTRLFKNELGMTPHQYLEARRLNEIRKTIREDPESQKSTAAIAMDNGLFHLGRFSSQFRRQFGLTPSEFRQELLGAIHAPPSKLAQQDYHETAELGGLT